MSNFVSTPALPQTGNTEERPEWKAFYSKQQQFRKAGINALNAEKELESHDECKGAASDSEIRQCVSRRFELMSRNYIDYMRAIGGLIRLNAPGTKASDLPPGGLGRAFDAAEAEWLKYRENECESVGNQYWSGTLRPGATLDCRVRLTQRHMRDLEDFYGDLWH